MRMLVLFLVAGWSGFAADLRYWVEPCTRPETKCESLDPQLAEWALEDWVRASGGALKLQKVRFRTEANIRLHWAGPNEGLYGEARPFVEDGIRGYNVYVLVDLRGAGPDVGGLAAQDPLFRETIVYLTCLHETGHALGLSHTDAFADIMYSFQFGGDIPEYFGRYRRQLKARADIAKTTGISAQDKARLVRALTIY